MLPMSLSRSAPLCLLHLSLLLLQLLVPLPAHGDFIRDYVSTIVSTYGTSNYTLLWTERVDTTANVTQLVGKFVHRDLELTVMPADTATAAALPTGNGFVVYRHNYYTQQRQILPITNDQINSIAFRPSLPVAQSLLDQSALAWTHAAVDPLDDRIADRPVVQSSDVTVYQLSQTLILTADGCVCRVDGACSQSSSPIAVPALQWTAPPTFTWLELVDLGITNFTAQGMYFQANITSITIWSAPAPAAASPSESPLTASTSVPLRMVITGQWIQSLGASGASAMTPVVGASARTFVNQWDWSDTTPRTSPILLLPPTIATSAATVPLNIEWPTPDTAMALYQASLAFPPTAPSTSLPDTARLVLESRLLPGYQQNAAGQDVTGSVTMIIGATNRGSVSYRPLLNVSSTTALVYDYFPTVGSDCGGRFGGHQWRIKSVTPSGKSLLRSGFMTANANFSWTSATTAGSSYLPYQCQWRGPARSPQSVNFSHALDTYHATNLTALFTNNTNYLTRYQFTGLVSVRAVAAEQFTAQFFTTVYNVSYIFTQTIAFYPRHWRFLGRVRNPDESVMSNTNTSADYRQLMLVTNRGQQTDLSIGVSENYTDVISVLSVVSSVYNWTSGLISLYPKDLNCQWQLPTADVANNSAYALPQDWSLQYQSSVVATYSVANYSLIWEEQVNRYQNMTEFQGKEIWRDFQFWIYVFCNDPVQGPYRTDCVRNMRYNPAGATVVYPMSPTQQESIMWNPSVSVFSLLAHPALEWAQSVNPALIEERQVAGDLFESNTTLILAPDGTMCTNRNDVVQCQAPILPAGAPFYSQARIDGQWPPTIAPYTFGELVDAGFSDWTAPVKNAQSYTPYSSSPPPLNYQQCNITRIRIFAAPLGSVPRLTGRAPVRLEVAGACIAVTGLGSITTGSAAAVTNAIPQPFYAITDWSNFLPFNALLVPGSGSLQSGVLTPWFPRAPTGRSVPLVGSNPLTLPSSVLVSPPSSTYILQYSSATVEAAFRWTTNDTSTVDSTRFQCAAIAVNGLTECWSLSYLSYRFITNVLPTSSYNRMGLQYFDPLTGNRRYEMRDRYASGLFTDQVSLYAIDGSGRCSLIDTSASTTHTPLEGQLPYRATLWSIFGNLDNSLNQFNFTGQQMWVRGIFADVYQRNLSIVDTDSLNRTTRYDLTQLLLLINGNWQLPGRSSFPDSVNDLHMPLQLQTTVTVLTLTASQVWTVATTYNFSINLLSVYPQNAAYSAYGAIVRAEMFTDLSPASSLQCAQPLGAPQTYYLALSYYSSSYAPYTAAKQAVADVNAAGILPFGSVLAVGGLDLTANGQSYAGTLTQTMNWQVRMGLPKGAANALPSGLSALAFVGDPVAATQLGLMSTYFERPNLNCLTGSYALQQDKVNYAYSMQTITTDRSDGLAFVALMRSYHWSKIGVVATQEANGQSFAAAMQSLMDDEMDVNFYYINYISATVPPTLAQSLAINQTLNLLAASGRRIFIYKGNTALSPYILMAAWDMGLLSSPYQWVVVSVCQGSYASTLINAGYAAALKAVPCLFSGFSAAPTLKYVNALYSTMTSDLQSATCYESVWLLAYAVRNVINAQYQQSLWTGITQSFNANGGPALLRELYNVSDKGPFSGLPLSMSAEGNLKSSVPLYVYSSDIDGGNVRQQTVANYDEGSDTMDFNTPLIFSNFATIPVADRDYVYTDGTLLQTRSPGWWTALSAVIGILTCWSSLQFIRAGIDARRQSSYSQKVGRSQLRLMTQYVKRYGVRLVTWMLGAAVNFAVAGLWSMDALQMIAIDYSPCTGYADQADTIANMLILAAIVFVALMLALWDAPPNTLNKYNESLWTENDSKQRENSQSSSTSLSIAKEQLRATAAGIPVLDHLVTVFGQATWVAGVSSALLTLAVIGATHLNQRSLRLCAVSSYNTWSVGPIISALVTWVAALYAIILLFQSQHFRSANKRDAASSLPGIRAWFLTMGMVALILVVETVNRAPYAFTFSQFYYEHPADYVSYDTLTTSNVWLRSPWASPSDWDASLVQVVVAALFLCALFVCVALLIDRNQLSRNIMDVQLAHRQASLTAIQQDIHRVTRMNEQVQQEQELIDRTIQCFAFVRPIPSNVALALALAPSIAPTVEPRSPSMTSAVGADSLAYRTRSLECDPQATNLFPNKSPSAVSILLQWLDQPRVSLASQMVTLSAQREVTIKRVLCHPVAFEVLRDFVTPGHSYSHHSTALGASGSRLLTLWLDINRMQRFTNAQLKQTLAKLITQTYLLPNSPLTIGDCLNESSTTASALKQLLQSKEPTQTIQGGSSVSGAFWLSLQQILTELIDKEIFAAFCRVPNLLKLVTVVLGVEKPPAEQENNHTHNLIDGSDPDTITRTVTSMEGNGEGEGDFQPFHRGPRGSASMNVGASMTSPGQSARAPLSANRPRGLTVDSDLEGDDSSVGEQI